MEQSDNTNPEIVKKIARDVIEYLLKHPKISRDKITNIKGRFGKKYHYGKVIKNASILDHATEKEKIIINKLLRRRSTRTISGVSVIAIMTEPLQCPGNCVFCPGSESQPGEKVAQSYTGREPAAMRSIHCNYEPYNQVKSRIADLEAIGHKVDKIELICMGGTLLSANLQYQESFIKGALEAIVNKRTVSLEEVKREAETSKRTLVGITIETRPDYCKEPQVDQMLNYGTTRVEIGVQTIFSDIYELVRRGHKISDTIDAIRISKDAGLKVNAHVMPNLPGSNLQRDEELFSELFENPSYRPDMLKIYPTVVIKGTELYNWWQEGKYQPYELDDLVDLIANAKENLPPYVRIQRIMRDIPATLIEAGCKNSNLRQLVKHRLAEKNSSCKCIRCREYGISRRKSAFDDSSLDSVQLNRLDYDASMGNEIFLSFENKVENYLVGYLRLRKPSEFAHRPELNDGRTMIVRELKVVGELVAKDAKPNHLTQIQHRGYGAKLMERAEQIALEEFDCRKLAVISGIGVRGYFYDLGYSIDGPYVSKSFKEL